MTLRRTPDDFVVEELPTEDFLGGLRSAPSASALQAVYRLEKTQLTTPHAAQLLAAALKVRNNAAAYAGLKDKHAVTVQMVTVAASTLADAAMLPREVKGPKWSASLKGWSAAAIDASALRGNRFRIVVRDVRQEQDAAMRFRASLLATGNGSLAVVNYFGAQRFGSARHGEGWIARELIAGRFEKALKLSIATPSRKDTGVTRTFTRMLAAGWGQPGAWARLANELPRCPEKKAIERLAFMASRRTEAIDERGFREAFVALPYFLQQLYVEAYQSHLWNDTVRRHLRRVCAASSLMKTEDEFGDMVFPAFAAASAELRSLEIPLVAPETVAREPWGEDLEATLKAEGLTPAELKIPGLRRPYFGEAMRPLFVAASGFSLGAAEPDELSKSKARRVEVRFDLPRGAYATVVMRALGQ
jgi:tRNA pseudouridine13 synthase